ncbi:MAG TPA: DUF1840 domain-containing protein [Hydrogenophaga sp.]|uniref:DUF1840 domain-containing protein n=1 Tax=Hydrogenophaga sp. TaxID=1904254 RepID=UPI002CCE0FB7|nr:DUF1840 domain-containing protein [Hydrogenophaga sp.]HMN93434.1 DUF1840 domain-containing protein [Hydrogenophaga sp.]HMP11434.1 DUF1840 domain-containing protein [Hydrogenophaga sp.]
MNPYRFKSRDTGDVVMLHHTGKRVLQILGKDPDAPGIILAEQMPAAVAALQDAILQEEAEQQRQKEEAQAKGELPPEFEVVSLRMRCAPLFEMMERCQKAGVEIVWGV